MPPIIICDEDGFKDLYETLVEYADDFDSDDWNEMLYLLQNRFVCLGIKCDQVGQSEILKGGGLENGDWPKCSDPLFDIDGYRGSKVDNLLQSSLVDLDVRTIGTLIEMDADLAAYDVYAWGRFSRDNKGQVVSMESRATRDPHQNNDVAKVFTEYFSETDFGNTDQLVYHSIMAVNQFRSATPTQRRIAAESAMVTMTMHVYAINEFFLAVDDCEQLKASVMNNISEQEQEYWHWDSGVASLTGWAEGDEDTDEGFLFFSVPRYLCDDDEATSSSLCDSDGNSEINTRLIKAFKDGKESLRRKECDDAVATIKNIEKLLQTILVDITAYFAKAIDENETN